MKVKELIKRLQLCDKNFDVEVWDAYSDGPVKDHVSIDEDKDYKTVLISNLGEN